MSKAVVYSISKGSAGTVGVSGTVNINAATVSLTTTPIITESINYGEEYIAISKSFSENGVAWSSSGTVAAHNGTLSGGSTNLTTKQYSAVLTSATTLTCDGPVEWQVVEYL
jgi:hypothetical protein